MTAMRVDSLCCRISEAIGAKRTCREHRESCRANSAPRWRSMPSRRLRSGRVGARSARADEGRGARSSSHSSCRRHGAAIARHLALPFRPTASSHLPVRPITQAFLRLSSPAGGQSNDKIKASLEKQKLEPNQQGTIGPTQMRSTWRMLPKNVELMPQHQHLGLQLLSRLEAVAQHADE